jgi:hypothetical protein
MPTSWEQKRAAIAAALAGGNAPSVGADPMVNPMIAAMSPQAPGVAGGSPGLMGAAPTQGAMMAQANASLQGAPGFDYAPPTVGPDPVATPAAGAAGPWTQDDKLAFLRGRPTQANQMAYTQALGQGAYDYNRQGRGGGGYTTSGRGGGRSSSWGGAQRGGGGLY